MRNFEDELRETLRGLGDPMAGFFGPGSASWRMNADPVTYLGGVRALLLQVAHPKVAQGVADHSNFERNPLGRLRGTFKTVHAIVFGTPEEAIAASVALHQMHSTITGRLQEPTPHFNDPTYAANDPVLQRWVWATLIDSAMYVHRVFLPPKPQAFWKSFYEESKFFGAVLGLKADTLPEAPRAFDAWFAEQLRSPMLGSTQTSRRVAAAIVRGPAVLRMTRPLLQGLGPGMLPEALVRQLGLPWARRSKVTYRASVVAARALVSRTPEKHRALPIARRALQRCGSI